MDIIDNIITYSLSVGYYVTKTSSNRSERYRTAIEYGLFNTTNFIRSLIYIRFGIILTQFYINFSRQEHQIDVFLICIVQNLRFSGFSLYPLSFFLYSPFNAPLDFSRIHVYLEFSRDHINLAISGAWIICISPVTELIWISSESLFTQITQFIAHLATEKTDSPSWLTLSQYSRSLLEIQHKTGQKLNQKDINK